MSTSGSPSGTTSSATTQSQTEGMDKKITQMIMYEPLELFSSETTISLRSLFDTTDDEDPIYHHSRNQAASTRHEQDENDEEWEEEDEEEEKQRVEEEEEEEDEQEEDVHEKVGSANGGKGRLRKAKIRRSNNQDLDDDSSTPFPGGPINRTTLMSFNNHIVACIWNNKVTWDPYSSIRRRDEDIAEVIFYTETIKYMGIVEPYQLARFLQ
ncbi:hypothetical protein Sjap_017174 [Stephania japonica]|uniref:Uncharacterized protein n=1 Tax=Stephania japonica TaxID=461633 RepID=A0AAP0I5P2_9MAGN